MKINPRFSLNTITGKDLKLGPVNEWYIATQYKGYNGGNNYYAGIGTDMSIPYLERFSLNFYKMFEHINGTDTDGDFENDSFEDDFEDAGWVVAINWFTKLKTFNDKFNLSFQGWSDFGFGNTWAEENNNYPEVDKGTPTEWQMFNGFFWNYKKWSVSTSVKLHKNFIYRETLNHDATSFFVGLHRRF